MNSKVEDGLGAISAEFHRIDGLYSKLSQKQGTTYSFVQVYYILKFNRASTQKQLSEIWQVPKQTVNNVIKKLIANKHITLVANSDDKREKKIQLTPLGETYTQKLLTPFFELNEMVGKRVGIDLLNNLSKGLKTLGDALELEMELKEVSSKWEDRK
jgi:DNA-binding MarR family transcriptional regulator